MVERCDWTEWRERERKEVVLNREGAAEKRIAKTNTKTADALPTRV
jgi:hypothetical protein